MKQRQRFLRAIGLGLFITAIGYGRASETPDRVQAIPLKEGWNAVFLEVDPVDTNPAVLFAGQPIDMVATYFSSETKAQFVTDPSVDLFKNLGWGVWYRGDRPDAFLSSLDAINGRRAYLVRAENDFVWNVAGLALKSQIAWRSGEFNFVGFPLANPGAPSFAQFFAGSEGPQTDRIYRLVDGSWQKLTDPAATPMRAGEAFWMFCDTPTTHSGPLVVETKIHRGIVLSDGGSDRLVLRNVSPDPLEVSVTHVGSQPAAVPLSIQVKVVGGPESLLTTSGFAKPVGEWTEVLNLEPGQSFALPFEARSGEMREATHRSLLKITTALGTESWVPVYATRSDLETSE